MTLSRFVSADQRFGLARYVDFENPLFEELEEALERAWAAGALNERDRPLELAVTLRYNMASRYGSVIISSSNQELMEARRPGSCSEEDYVDFYPCRSLEVICGQFELEVSRSETFSDQRVKEVMKNAQTLALFERTLPAAIARALELGAHPSLATYKSPGAKPLAELEAALAAGGAWRRQNDLTLLAPAELFCVALQTSPSSPHSEAAYFGAGAPVIALSQAAFFSTPEAAAENARPFLAALGDPEWAIARIAAAPVELLRLNGEPTPSLPVFESVLALSQAREIQRVTEAPASASVRAPRL